MKKYLFAILLLFPFLVKAQYYTTVWSATETEYVYVGSLTYSGTDVNNHQKIKIDIFGGGWTSTGLGATTYYIGNRYGLVVNQTTIGSSNDNIFTLHAYTNSTTNAIDFYVVTTNAYAAFGIKSVNIQDSDNPVDQYLPITSSTTVPSGTPVAFTINPVMITDAVGNIGIGTTNPTGYKMAVNGGIHAQQVNVDLSGWSDYVFDKDYHLPTLTETAAYINQNHHLAEIPSAAEITKNGLDLGEMNKLLLKKVEELTLYLIEKDKEIKEEKDLACEQKRALKDQSTQLKLQQEQINQLKNQMELILKTK
jgi:hypothetical protein